MNYTKSGLADLQAQLADYEDKLKKGIATAAKHVKAIHNSTLMAVPEDLEERLLDATDRGDLVIREDGAVHFASGAAKQIEE